MKHQIIKRAILPLVVLLGDAANADFEELFGQFSTELEEQSARAALETYERLKAEAGCNDRIAVDPGAGDGNLCTGNTFNVFKNVREIIHTGNDLTGSGPTEFSLRANLEGVGFALRWLAAEEYAAQGDMSSDFVGAQVSGLSSRLTALRFGAQGFQFAGRGVWQPQNGEYAGLYGTKGGAAGSSSGYSRWGGFLNIQQSSGSRSSTLELSEDAFDLEGTSVSVGADYRLTDEWILGLVLGYSEQEIDFDGTQSVVEGGIESEGISVMPFFMYQPGNFYVSGSMGLQQISFDSNRAIRYPSFNPSITSVNTETVSQTDATVFSLFTEVGYTFSWRQFSVEPYASVNISNTVIDEFVEDDINDEGFDLIVKEQSIDATDLTAGLKFQYVFTPRLGVIIPYVTVELVNQLETASRNVEAYYDSLTTDDSVFFIPTEELDSRYFAYTYGLSTVLRGGREKTPGGGVGGDLQAFFNVKTISGLEGYSLDFYTLGLRYAF